MPRAARARRTTLLVACASLLAAARAGAQQQAPDPSCAPAAAAGAGAAGTRAGVLRGDEAAPGAVGSCRGATDGPAVGDAPAARAQLSVAPGLPLTVDTCDSSFDTLLFAGEGCDDGSPYAFGCVAANDDATERLCSTGASRVTLTPRGAAVQLLLQGWRGAAGNWTLSWRQEEPPPSGSGTGTPAVTPPGTGSRSPGSSATGTGSRSPTRTASPTRSPLRFAPQSVLVLRGG